MWCFGQHPKKSLDEQINKLEQHWVRTQTNNVHHPPTPSGESTSTKSSEENATAVSTTATPSLVDRLTQIKPNMTYASAVVALFIAAIVLLLLILLRTGFPWDCEDRHVTRIIIKNIYKIARMSQGSIKKMVNYGKGISLI